MVWSTGGAVLRSGGVTRVEETSGMDWSSLNIEEKMLHFILPLWAILSMASVYLTSSYRTMVGIYVLGVVIGLIIVVPDWPYFYRSPLSWNEPLGVEIVQPRQSLPNSHR